MGAPTLTFLKSLPTALFTRTEHGALASCAPCNQSASRGSNVGPPLGAEGTPLGGCQGEALKYSKLMHGSSPSQRLLAVLLFLVRVSRGHWMPANMPYD